VTRLELTTHTGTHLDVERHLSASGTTVDRLPLDLLLGRALVADLTGVREIDVRHLQRLPLRRYERVLLKTDNSRLWEQPGFSSDFAHLTTDGAAYLLECGVRLVGLDYLSVERRDGDGSVHRLLLAGKAVILEGLNLQGVEAGEYELLCLPLKVRDGDGAPARAILRRPREGEPRRTLDTHTSRWPLA
jgi:arylformamidase